MQDPFQSDSFKAVWNFVDNNDSGTNHARANAHKNNQTNFGSGMHQPSTSSGQGRSRRADHSRMYNRNDSQRQRSENVDVSQVPDTENRPNARSNSNNRGHPTARGNRGNSRGYQNAQSNQGNRGYQSNRGHRNDRGNRTHQDGQHNQGNRNYPNGRGQHASDAKSQREYPMGYKEVLELAYKEPNEILLTINRTSSGFSLLLQQDKIKHDVMAFVIICLAKAVTSRMRNNVSAMINMVTSDNNNFKKNITPYLAQCQKLVRTNEEHHLESLVSLADFLYKFQVSLRSSATDTIIEVLPLLERTCTLCLEDNEPVRTAVMEKLAQMEEQNRHFLKEYTPIEIKRESQKERLQNQNPPDSYRSIPVLPTIEDIQNPCSFLRPNLVKGQYQDTDHYLDVQFRLLREDYVKPLRDGIAEYRTLKKLGKSYKQCKDVKVYPDVRIVKQDFVNGGLVHIAYFNDEKFSKIKWEYSKRFLTGSLLCLSSDDFETMLFATIAKRDVKELVKGLLLLKFENVTDEVLNLNPLRSFVVVETSAYFEAYRHNLDALLDLNENTLPMKPYIVEVEKEVHRPHYLQETSTYDMRPLLIPMNDTNIIYQNINGNIVPTYNFPDNISQASKNVRILNDGQWPTAAELNLDLSQYAAIKAAVTKEFAVIQGPPGTGKTYVGLRIAQLLLHNMQSWRTERDMSPILVVCYTNHALDQFLEGLMLFTQKIVRVGGRCQNEALDKFHLRNVKRVVEDKREVPTHIFRGIGHKKYEIRLLNEKIERFRRDAERSFATVLEEYILKDHMSAIHYAYLKSRHNYLLDDEKIMLDWLNVRARNAVGEIVDVNYDDQETKYEAARPNYNFAASNNPMPRVPDDNAEIEEEGDIEFIEAQRDINSEEFNDVSFEVPQLLHRGIEIVSQVDDDGWQVQGGKKKLRKYVTRSLNTSQAMTETEADNIEDVWNLTLFERWRLYKLWLERYINEKQKEVYDLQLELQKEYKELCEMRTEEDLYVCQQAHIVGMTTTGAAKYRNIVQYLNPKIVIVEEAAEILESHIVTSLAPNTQHVILIGDHQQLKPSPAVYELAVRYDLNVSLFERMVKNGMDCYRLGIQHRMRPEIAALLVPHIYADLQNHESVNNFENIKGISKNVYFLTHDHMESSDSDSRSKANQHEALFLIKLCRYILLQGYDPSQITVLTTYTGQLFALKKLVANNSLLKAVRFTVVDNYQGEENDIILISFVRSNDDGVIGFLKVSNRVCVALSRAKKGLFCIGNFELLVEKSELWKNITGVLHKAQAIGPSLQLRCQNHPGVSSVVASEKDFDSVPEGGCTRNCEFRLKCGHVCALMCHPYDTEHINIRCLKPCTKTCSYGHKCKKSCYEECGDCTQKVDKRLSICGHEIKVACYVQNEEVVCTERCESLLTCGHLCANTCGVACVMRCKKKVKNITSSVCGHKVELECCNIADIDCLIRACKEPCRVQLSCGHACNGTCSDCHQGRLHIVCKQKCQRILVCGHECSAKCSKTCPPCRKKCENLCVHSRCPKKCGVPCEICAEPCEWSCPHWSCSQICGQLCDRPPCDKPCTKLLPCEHECIGLCGEPCPSECGICDKEKVTEIFLGSEDEEGARFIKIEECNHIFEVGDITRWMNSDLKGEIQMKTCPRCKCVIRKNLRFGNIVKTCLSNIEKVKKKTYGDLERNKNEQEELLIKLESQIGNEKISNIFEPLLKTVSASKIRSIQELTVMHNIINFSTSLAKAIDFIDNLREYKTFSDTVVQESYDNLRSFMRRSKNWLIRFMQDEYLTASEQQLQEIAREVDRMKVSNLLLKFLDERTETKSNTHLTKLVKCLVKFAPFLETDIAICSADFRKVVELSGSAVINVSDLEKEEILKAMGLSKGHWYQCPNGHVYCITECGGAMQVSHCNDCGATIGGTNHALVGNNRVATAMDGSQHGAWSDAMNMENYRF